MAEVKLEDADLRAAPPDENGLDELFESDDLLSFIEAKSILHDAFFGVFRLIRFVVMVTVPVLSAVVGWYAGRDELKPLACTLVEMSDCVTPQLVGPMVQNIETNWFEPPMQRYSLPKFIGDDSPAKLPALAKIQRLP